MKNHMEELKRRFGNDEGELSPKLPLFPNANGEVISKRMAVDAISHAATLSKQQIYGEDGELLIGGHTLQITGAQM